MVNFAEVPVTSVELVPSFTMYFRVPWVYPPLHGHPLLVRAAHLCHSINGKNVSFVYLMLKEESNDNTCVNPDVVVSVLLYPTPGDESVAPPG